MSSQQPSRSDTGILQVFIFRDGRFWGTECFSQPRVMIGRSPETDLQLDDDVISRNHATLLVTPEGVVLEDLRSANGTHVNGETVARCLVDSRDEISIGIFTLKIKLLGKKKAEPRFHDDTQMVKSGAPEEDATEVTHSADPAPALEEERTVQKLPSFVVEDGKLVPRPEPGKSEPRRGAAPKMVAEELGAAQGVRWLAREPEGGSKLEPAERPAREPAPRISMESLDAAAKTEAVAFPSFGDKESVIPTAVHSGEAAVEGEDECDDDDEDEREERNFVEPFSLLNNLVRDNFTHPPLPTQTITVVEVIGYSSEKKVLGYDQVLPGERFRMGSKKFVLLDFVKEGTCKLMFNDSFSGGVITGGRTVPIQDLKGQATRVEKRRGEPIYAYQLGRGDYANLVHEGGGSFMRFVHPPKLPEVKRFNPDPVFIKSLGSAVLLHLLFGLLLGVFSRTVEAGIGETDRFAKVDLKDIVMDKPQEEPPEIPLDQLQPAKQEEVKPDKEVEKPKEEPKPSKAEKVKPDKSRSKPKGSGGDEAAGVGIMAALGNLSQKAPATNIVAAVSNIDAVRVPGGKARFKVSGVVTKLPTSNVVFSRGTGVGVKADIDLLRGGKGRGGAAGIGPGALTGGTTGRRGIGGVVFQAPKHKMTVRGQLGREEIARVVQQHLREIQYCYEKNLMLNPSLAGKVIMEWTIVLSGSVSVVKTNYSSMQSPAVSMCMAARIKEWKFPAPRGGSVVVSYPFIFNQVGF